ncbi:malate synthase G, partial [Candidatus Pelagibacter bacterium]|nr:malate synthase G [Candidatus Pelagibacter bacterium]
MSVIDKNGLRISTALFKFINEEIIPGTNIKSDDFWDKFEKVVHELAPINKNLIKKREAIQKMIDEWHINNKGKKFNKKEYTNFLRSIDY